MPESRVSYFREKSWSDQPGPAEFRLDSSAESFSNRLWVSRQGEWVLADEARLSGQQRGFEYQISGQGQDMISFQGVRIIDQILLQGPLRGRAIYDQRGQLAPDPKQLGYKFALSIQDAKAFTEAVRAVGGKIIKEGQPSPPAPKPAQSQQARLEEICRLDLHFAQQFLSGQEQNRASFDERGRIFSEIISELRSESDPDTEALNKLQRSRDRAERIVERFLKEDSIADQLLFSDLSATLGKSVQVKRLSDGLAIEFPGAELIIKSDQVQWRQGQTVIDALPATD